MVEPTEGVTLYRLLGSRRTWKIVFRSQFPTNNIIVECVETGIERHCKPYDLIKIEEGK